MVYKTTGILRHIIPFIGLGIFLVLMVIAFVVLSYLFLVGGIIGLILFSIFYIKEKFFTGRKTNAAVIDHKSEDGKIYEHKDHH